MAIPDDHILSILVLLFELVQALLNEAVATGLVKHGHPVYLYYPSSLNCSDTEFNLPENQTALGNLCNRGAGIALLVIFSIFCVIPMLLDIIVLCTHCKALALQWRAQPQERKSMSVHSGEDYSPLITILYKMSPSERKVSPSASQSSSIQYSVPIAKTTSKASLLAFFLKSVAITLYFLGDNLEPILHRYGDCVDCNYDCVHRLTLLAKGAVVVATILFFAIPRFVQFLVDQFNWKYEPSDRYEVLGIFGLVLKAQSIYSSSIAVFQAFDYCSNTEQILGWLLVIAITTIATVMIIYKVISFPNTTSKGKNNEEENITMKQKCFNGLLFGSLAFVFLFFFLLADNLQPLDCAFQCDLRGIVNSDVQQNTFEGCCRFLGNVVTRLSLITVGIVIGFFFSLILGLEICLNEESSTTE